jgi:hypothetical protein
MGWGHGSYAAGMPVISAQARKARARAARYRVAEARSRRRWKRFPIGFRAEENHWFWPANVKRFIWRKRCRLAASLICIRQPEGGYRFRPRPFRGILCDACLGLADFHSGPRKPEPHG